MNRHATIRKDANVLSTRWLFGFITNSPIPVDPLKADNAIIALMNGKRFKVRSLIGHFCDISEIFFGRKKLIIIKLKSKNSE